MSFTLNNIDKSYWKLFPFEKIAKRVSESVDPKTTDLTIYYGLEHLDGETIHIRRNGAPDDVSGGKLKCYPGDIIFGKRRAYQRKAGIVKETGICSAHAFVFRANEDVIDMNLFPFFLHSDQFMHRMVDISVGGLSPTINWSDLRHQDFLLPPKEQQAELADLLWAMDEAIEKDLVLLERLKDLKRSKVQILLFDTNNPLVSLRNYIKEKKEISNPPHLISKYIGLEHIQVGKNFTNEYADSSIVLSNCFKVKKGDLCYSKLRPYLDKAIIADFDCVCTTEIIVLNGNGINNKLLLSLLHSFNFLEYIKDKGYGTKMPRVNFNILSEFKFNLPFNFEMIEKTIDNLDNSILSLESKIQSSKALQKSLINQIF
ncbi:MAG: restriction endonuclease subunit S [Sphingobacterium sp.]